MSTSDKPLEERLRFIKHKGKAVFEVNLTNCTSKELLLLLEQIRANISHHPPNSVLIFADFTGATIDKKVATRMKEVMVLDRPFVKRSAWIGTESVPEVFYEHFKNFSQRDFPTFKTREEALEWLTADS
jgi:hypothetical protein